MQDIALLKKNHPLQLWATNLILRKKAAPVKHISRELRDFCDVLQELSWAYDGVWLAAPQLGRSERIIFITQWNTKPKKWELLKQEVMINPEIISINSDMEVDEEGCLSLPGVKGNVARASKITVSYQNIQGKKMRITAQGFNARVILHEIDHLDGVLFIDKLVSV